MIVVGIVAGFLLLAAIAAGYLQQTVAPAPPTPSAPPAATFDPGNPAPGEVYMGNPAPAAVTQWRDLAATYAQINSILDPEEILAIIWNESTGDPRAYNPKDPSVGLMGVTLFIGRAYAAVASLESLYDPDTNVKAGSAFLAYLKANYEPAYPLSDPENGWVQMYNLGETKFRNGVRNPAYQAAFSSHLTALKT